MSDWKETLKLLMVEGHKLSTDRPPAVLLEDNLKSVDKSWPGVDGLVGEGGVEGRFLSADWALFCTNWEEDCTVLEAFGEEQRRGVERAEGVGDLYLELTSLVRDRRVAVGTLFLSARTSGFLLESDSNTSIHTIKIKPHR